MFVLHHKTASKGCMGLRPWSRTQSHYGFSLCSSALIRNRQNVNHRRDTITRQSVRSESPQQLQPDVAEAGSSDQLLQQQQTLDALVPEQLTDGTATLSDMSVEDPPTFKELGIDKLLVVSMQTLQTPSALCMWT
jgi:hypothetical protein